MNEDLSALRDPVSGSTLEMVGSKLVAGASEYPVVGAIPRFVPVSNYADDFGKQWNRFPKVQLDSHTGTKMSENRLARCLRGELPLLAGKRVLEAGSGAGRFTEVLLKAGAVVASFDFSNAVEANASNNGDSDRLTLVQGDIRHIPFTPEHYDYVICLGVVQHTPSPEETIASLWRMVKPGGRLVIDHYRFRWRFALPTPVGDAASVYRWLTLRLPARWRYKFVERVTNFWFPIHWRFKDSLLTQRVIRRFSPVRFYYPELERNDRELHYSWSLLDTHDSTTDFYKHLRSVEQITAILESLGATEIVADKGGNGVEAWCRKPLH